MDDEVQRAVENLLLTTRGVAYRLLDETWLIEDGKRRASRLTDELRKVYYNYIYLQPAPAYYDWVIGLGRLARSVHDGFESKWFSHILDVPRVFPDDQR